MQNHLQSFFYDSKEVRTVVIDRKPWFVASDICEYFGVTNRNRIMQQLDVDVKGGTQMNTPGGVQNVVVVNEAGVYSLLFALQPRKARGVSQANIEKRCEELRRFRRWITHDVLPAIRKYGAYLTDDLLDATMENDEMLARIAAQLHQERTKTRFHETRLQANLPKMLFADAVSASPSSILIGDLAKLMYQNGVDIGRNRLFAWMRANGFLMKQGASRNTPTQRAMEAGLFRLSESVSIQPYARIHLTKTPQVTGKGQRYFIDTFCGSTAIH